MARGDQAFTWRLGNVARQAQVRHAGGGGEVTQSG